MSTLKQYGQVLRGQVTDFTHEQKASESFLYAENLRFNTGKELASGGFITEKGTLLEFELPTLKSIQTTSGYAIKYGNDTLPYRSKEEGASGNLIPTELHTLFYNGTSTSKTSGKQLIVEVIQTEDGFVIFSTDNNGFDCIWTYTVTSKKLSLMYVRNMGFSTERPIKAIYNYENSKIKKIYWIDGVSQMRFINLENKVKNGDYEDLIDVKLESINQVGLFDISQPEVEVMSNGGSHTAGTIQYAYNLYKINGNQTKLSPLSNMVSLGNGDINGGNVNDKVTDLPKLTIRNIDKNYTNIRIYAIKYTSYNELPSVTIIADRKLSTYEEFSLYDTGLLFVQSLSIEQLLFIGSDPIYPGIIESRDNYLFMANYIESKYELKNFNARCFSFKKGSSITTHYNKFKTIVDSNGEVIGVEPAPNSLRTTVSRSNPYVFIGDDMVAMNIEDNLYTEEDTTLGMVGPNLKLTFFRRDRRTLPHLENVLKDNEIYRFSIKLYNGYGQYTDPLFIGDYYTGVIEDGSNKTNLNGYPLVVELSLGNHFKSFLANESNFLDINGKFDPKLRPVGFKLMRAIRNQEDRLIVVQGIVNPMISTNPYKSAYNETSTVKEKLAKEGFKMPWLLRTNSELIYPLQKYSNYKLINDNYANVNGLNDRATEVFSSVTTSSKRTSHFQFTKQLQLFAPELTFNHLNVIDTTSFRIKGLLETKEDSVYAAEVNTASLNKDALIKVFNRISPYAKVITEHLEDKDTIELNGDSGNLFDFSLVGPTGGDSAHSVQFYRDYTGSLKSTNNNKLFNTLGRPVLVERGQGETSYNGNPLYTFTNKFNRFRTDTPKSGSGGTSDPKGKSAITKFNSDNERNITFVEEEETTLEEMLSEVGLAVGDDVIPSIPLVEFVRPIYHYYLNNMYGGNTEAGKLSTNYTEIGSYSKIYYDGINLLFDPCRIEEPGDIFVGDFEFERISNNQALITTDSYNAIEIVKFKVETTVDLNRRSDLSRYSWDSFFMPEYEDYHKYNRVYSQQTNIFTNVNDAYNYKGNNEFGNRIIATRKKNSGELIDSWTDIMVNNFIDLDGKYGKLTDVKSFGNGLITFQKGAVGMVAVNPRTQVVDTNGIDIELGRGDVLHDYQYISTTYGSSHPHSILLAKSGLYFFDSINKAICGYEGNGVNDLGKVKGNSTFIKEQLKDKKLETNPFEGRGINMGYNQELGDIMLVLNNKTTITYNEEVTSFTGVLPYSSPKIINYGENSYSVDPNNLSALHIHTKGSHNVYYGKHKSSKLKFLLNPEPLNDCIFTNVSFKSEAYKDGVLTNSNWNTVKLHNEYQDSGTVELVERVNTRKLNRMTNITLPREKGTRNKIRNNWSIVEFEYFNNGKYLFRNNTFVISYIVVDRIIN